MPGLKPGFRDGYGSLRVFHSPSKLNTKNYIVIGPFFLAIDELYT